MIDPFAGRPNDVRGLIHKKIAGIAISIGRSIPGVGTAIGIAEGIFAGGRGPAIPGRAFRCPPGSLRDRRGDCEEALTNFPVPGRVGRGFVDDGRDIVSPSPGFGRPAGEAVLGRHGAALQPMAETREVRSCLRGMVLGNDGLCYNKRDLSNSERWWPRGRRPLLTGGEMRAIQIASTAARKLQSAHKRLTALGLLKKPATRRAPPQPKLLTMAKPGTSIINVD